MLVSMYVCTFMMREDRKGERKEEKGRGEKREEGGREGRIESE